MQGFLWIPKSQFTEELRGLRVHVSPKIKKYLFFEFIGKHSDGFIFHTLSKHLHHISIPLFPQATKKAAQNPLGSSKYAPRVKS